MSTTEMTTQTADATRTLTKPAIAKPAASQPLAGKPINEAMITKSKVIESSQLFDHRSTVTILHRGEQYTLRLTASNKLILTK